MTDIVDVTVRDELYTVFKDNWKFKAFYDDDGGVPEGVENEPFAIITFKRFTSNQKSLADRDRLARWETRGALYIYCMFPMTMSMRQREAITHTKTLQLAYSHFKGTAECRNCRVTEIGRVGNFDQYNVVVDFFFDDFRKGA